MAKAPTSGRMRLLRAIGVIALTIVALPLAIIGGVIGRKGRESTPNELASELSELARGDMSGWDDLECGGPFRDPRLEAIRQEAMAVELPFREEDRALLARLAAKAHALQSQE